MWVLKRSILQNRRASDSINVQICKLNLQIGFFVWYRALTESPNLQIWIKKIASSGFHWSSILQALSDRWKDTLHYQIRVFVKFFKQLKCLSTHQYIRYSLCSNALSKCVGKILREFIICLALLFIFKNAPITVSFCLFSSFPDYTIQKLMKV